MLIRNECESVFVDGFADLFSFGGKMHVFSGVL